MNKSIQTIKQNMFAIHQLTERDKRHENSATFLGELWEILNPLIMTVVMVLVFSTMFASKSIENYPLFVLTGMTIFNYFSQGTTACLNALVGNKSLLIRSQMKRGIYVIQKITTVFRSFLLSLLIYAFFLAIYQYTPQVSWLAVIPAIFLLSMMMVGMGKILSVVNVYFADVTHFYRIFVLFVFYGSALFCSADRYPKVVYDLMFINPVYDVIEICRRMIINDVKAPVAYWIALITYAMGTYVLGTVVFNKYSDDVVAKM